LTLPETIDEFVSAFQNVYGQYDEKRSEEQQWLLIVEESSRIAEAVREGSYESILEHLTNLFVWLCGFIAKCIIPETKCYLKDDFSTIIWIKFQQKCARCDSKPCQCLSSMKRLMKREKAQKEEAYNETEKNAREQIDSRPKKLDDIVAMFNEIFYSNIMITDIKEIAFHLLEEVGEVSEQIRELKANIEESNIKFHKTELRRELADVFSWVMALLIKVNLLGDAAYNLTKTFASLQEKQSIEIEPITVNNSLLRILVQKFYSEGDQLVCKTCRKQKCDLSLHPKHYPVSIIEEKK